MFFVTLKYLHVATRFYMWLSSSLNSASRLSAFLTVLCVDLHPNLMSLFPFNIPRASAGVGTPIATAGANTAVNGAQQAKTMKRELYVTSSRYDENTKYSKGPSGRGVFIRWPHLLLLLPSEHLAVGKNKILRNICGNTKQER